MKGPVASWAKANLGFNHCLSEVCYQREQSWTEQLTRLGACHVVFATGFTRLLRDAGGLPDLYYRNALGVMESINVEEYNRDTGQIGPHSNIFGGGMAFPHNVTDASGFVEPWVGFAFGVKNTAKSFDTWAETSQILTKVS